MRSLQGTHRPQIFGGADLENFSKMISAAQGYVDEKGQIQQFWGYNENFQNRVMTFKTCSTMLQTFSVL